MTAVRAVDVRPTAPASPGTLRAVGRPWVVAHRGNSSVAPENTAAAFESALRAGADWLEIDLHLSRDGQAVVLHDPTLDATTDGAGALHEVDAGSLAQLDAGRWFADAYAGQRVPVLGDVLALLERYPASGALLEFKGTWSADQLGPAVAAIRASAAADRVVVQGFSVATVEALQAIAPELPRGLLTVLPGAGAGQLCRRLDLAAYNPSVAGLLRRPEVVAEVHEAGAAVWTWTVDEPELWAWLLGAGADGVITNRPDRLAGWLAATLAPRVRTPVDLHRLAAAQGHRAPAAGRSRTVISAAGVAPAEPLGPSQWQRLAGQLATR